MWVFTPTAKNKYLSEPAYSCKTATISMSSDMSGTLSDMPDGTTPPAKMLKSCLSAEERPNKTPIFIIGASDTRAYLACMHKSCTSGLSGQLKGLNLMVALSTANGFTLAVSQLLSLGGRE
jgi:hypothetical protein